MNYKRSEIMEQIREFETFEPSQIITPDDYPLPKEGHIGYVKFENPYEYIGLCEPQWGDVDLRTGEVIS